MIVNPGIRRFLGSAIQRLFNSASVSLPLTHTAIPTRGSITPTFTRASTATFTDWEGVLRTVPSGCARFEGGRMVRNLFVTTTADMSNAAWTKSNISVTTGQTDPDGNTTAMKLVEAAGAGVTPQIYQSGNGVSGNTTVLWIIAKAAERSWLVINNNQGTGGGSIRVWFNLTAGTVGTVGAGGTAAIESLGDGWYLCSVLAVMSNGSNCLHIFQVSNADNVSTYAGDGASGIYVWHPQFEDVTAQTTKIAGEYVSVGVLSDPWHGAGVDGVEFFNTDRDGAVLPAATNTGYLAETADVLAYPTASNILAAASTVYLEFTPDHTPSGTIALWGTYVDASNYTAILHDATNMIMRKRIAGVNYDATIANAFTANTTYKVCGSWGASGVTVTVNGTEGTPHANTTAAQIAATMQWGADGNSLQQPFATERNARVWQRQLSASERMVVTS